VIPANIRTNFTSPETRKIVLPAVMLKTARSYLHSSGQRTGMWRKDWQTDRWTNRRIDRQILSGFQGELLIETQCIMPKCLNLKHNNPDGCYSEIKPSRLHRLYRACTLCRK